MIKKMDSTFFIYIKLIIYWLQFFSFQINSVNLLFNCDLINIKDLYHNKYIENRQCERKDIITFQIWKSCQILRFKIN